jgi:hypothetical protein
MFVFAVAAAALCAASQVRAQQPAPAPTADQKGQAPTADQKGQAPTNDIFAQAPAERSEPSTGTNPRMIGDLPGLFSLRGVTPSALQAIQAYQVVSLPLPRVLAAQSITKQTTPIPSVGTITKIVVESTFVQGSAFQFVPQALTNNNLPFQAVTRVPVASFGSFKVAENQSPLPEDRVFLTYNFFGDVRGPAVPQPNVAAGPQLLLLGNSSLGASAVAVPVVRPVQADINRGVFGFEKTFLDGTASVTLRLPLFTMQADGGFSQHDLGDLSLLFNYAFYLDRDTGNVVTSGLMVTLPTGPHVLTLDGDIQQALQQAVLGNGANFDRFESNIHPVLLQPFVGARWNFDRCYVLGFSSLMVPTDARAPTILFNDVGAGYRLYQGTADRAISAIIPTLEAHLSTPLRRSQATDPLILPDTLTLTAGVHIGLFGRSMLTIGVVTPVTGPRPFDVEAVAQFNYQF